MPYRFVPLSQGSSYEQDKKAINANFAELDNEAVTKVFKGPNGVNALITGRLPNNLGYGTMLTGSDGVPTGLMYVDANGDVFIKTTPAGVDVTTATEDQYNFNSARKTFKIVDEIDLSVDVNNSPGTYGYYSDFQAHGLGFAPAYIAFVDHGTGRSHLPAVEYIATGAPGSQILEVSLVKNVIVDSTNVTAYIETIANIVDTYDFKIYILQETAE